MLASLLQWQEPASVASELKKIMFRSLNIAATGMSAQQTQLESISNNVANANTVGYKKQRTEFQDLMYQTIREPGTPTGPTTRSPNRPTSGSPARSSIRAPGGKTGSAGSTRTAAARCPPASRAKGVYACSKTRPVPTP